MIVICFYKKVKILYWYLDAFYHGFLSGISKLILLIYNSKRKESYRSISDQFLARKKRLILNTIVTTCREYIDHILVKQKKQTLFWMIYESF